MLETAMRIVTSRSNLRGGARPLEIHVHYRLPACVVTAKHDASNETSADDTMDSAPLKPLEHREVHRLVHAGLSKLLATPGSAASEGASSESTTVVSPANDAINNELAAQQSTLTPREHEVMELMLTGKTQKQIAAELQVSVQTAAKHRAKVLEKLRVANDVELLRVMLSLDPPAV